MPELTVLYDEGCALCAGLSARLAGADTVSVAPIGSELGKRLLRDLTLGERYASMHVVDAEGTRRSGAEALPPVLRALRGGRLPARVVEVFPRTAALAYRLVARNRSRLSRVQARSVSRR